MLSKIHATTNNNKVHYVISIFWNMYMGIVMISNSNLMPWQIYKHLSILGRGSKQLSIPCKRLILKGGTEDVVQKQEQHVNSLVWIVEAHGRLTRKGEEAQQHNFI